jgi:hypothetical protein
MMEKSELKLHLLRNHAAFTGFVRNLSDVLANNAMPGKWTPVQQMSHIVKSVSPVKIAFSVPKFCLVLFFGKSNRPSRSYNDLVSKYKAKLEAGGKSTTRFLPDTSCDRINLQDSVERHVNILCKKVDRFSEAELDKLLLPHPLLGKLTLREMLYFTIYHVHHHHAQINPALQQSTAPLLSVEI